jgi:hypothetical protein
MRCSERQRLFDDYYDRVSAYMAATDALNHMPRWPPANDRLVRAAAIAAEHARLILERHDEEHGCGQLESLCRTDDQQVSIRPTGGRLAL